MAEIYNIKTLYIYETINKLCYLTEFCKLRCQSRAIILMITEKYQLFFSAKVDGRRIPVGQVTHFPWF